MGFCLRFVTILRTVAARSATAAVKPPSVFVSLCDTAYDLVVVLMTQVILGVLGAVALRQGLGCGSVVCKHSASFRLPSNLHRA